MAGLFVNEDEPQNIHIGTSGRSYKLGKNFLSGQDECMN